MKFGKGSNCCTSTNQAMDSLSLKNENEQTHAYYKKMIAFMRYTYVMTTDSSSSRVVRWSLVVTDVSMNTCCCIYKV